MMERNFEHFFHSLGEFKSQNLSFMQDFHIQCKDGEIVRVPKLLMASLCIESQEILDNLDDFMILPDADSQIIEGFFNSLIGFHKSVKVDFLHLSTTFPWINWTIWRREPQLKPSAVISSSIIDHLVSNLPIAQVSKPTLKLKKAKKIGPKTFQCQICGKALCDKHSLKKHEDAVHFNIRNFGCEFCSKRFSVRKDLSDHVRTVHLKLKICVCDVCGLSLSTSHSLHTHKLLHSEENSKSINCHKCSKSFRHKSTYRKHVARIHDFDPSKRLKCPHCFKFYNHKEGLNRHVKKFHSSLSEQFKCGYCQSAFAFKYDLTRHHKRYHPDLKISVLEEL